MARIVFVLGEDFEDSEYRVPYDRLTAAGHDITVLGTNKGKTVSGKNGRERVQIDVGPGDVRPEDFDAMVIPGGYSPDHLRTDRATVNFVRQFGLMRRPVAAVCHGPSLLIEADLVEGRRVTSWPSIHTDLVNAGAFWEDAPVVEDGPLITSRNPQDLPVFADAILNRIGVLAPA
jgi:protease I